MNIVYTVDDKFAWLAGVSLLSFLKNNKGITHNVFVLDNNISKENKDKISIITNEYDAKAFFIDVRNELLQLRELGLNDSNKKCPMIVFARLIAIDLLPDDIERVLYIDGDTLIIKNISELESIQMNKALMMRADCMHSVYKKYIGMSKKEKYYNGGLMLINVPIWKRDRCKEKIFDFIKRSNIDFGYFDQDFINKAVHNDIEDLDIYGYNCQSQMFVFDYKRCMKLYRLNEELYLAEEEYNKTTKDPKILHFCGNSFIRPWYINTNHPYALEWKKYFDKSPWARQKLETYKPKIYDRVRYFLRSYFSKDIELAISKIGYRCYYIIKYKI